MSLLCKLGYHKTDVSKQSLNKLRKYNAQAETNCLRCRKRIRIL